MKFSLEMMTRNVDYARFYRVYFSDEFSREIALAVHLSERSIVERVTLADGTERTRVRIVPHVALPAVIQKLLSGNPISYEEITVLDPVTRRVRFGIESPAGDVVQVHGEAQIVESEEGVRFRFEGDARIKVFGIGGMIERFLVHEVKARYALVEHALQRYVDEGRDRA